MSEATARIRINRLLEEAGWRFFDEDDGPANVRLEADVKLKPADLDALGDDFEHAKNGRVDFLLLDGRGRPFVVLEAKRERLNPLTGKEQARRYARSLDCRFVILSNGNLHYFWDLERGNPNVVAAFPKPDAVAEYERREPPDRGRLAAEPVGADYIALTQRPGYASEAAWRNEAERAAFVRARGLRFLRPYQTDAIHALQRAARDGADRFLFEMATGTGKTLTAAAAIKLFLRTGAARRALFLVDRLELEAQAERVFRELLDNDFRTVVYKESREDWRAADVVISTVQSLLFDNKHRRLFSPTDFDLVISDEAHRSIGGNARAVFEYFTGWKLGLTATPRDYLKGFDGAAPGDPREAERRLLLDTYRTFGCESGQPTFRYSLLDGVRDGHLVNPTVVDARTEVTTQLLSDEGYAVRAFDEESGEEREETFDQRDFGKRFFSPATDALFCRAFLDHALRDPVSGEIGKSIVFAVSQDHAARLAQTLNELAHERFPGRYASDFAVQVTSSVADAQRHAIDFANNRLLGSGAFLPEYRTSKARACVTVGMMTTGYDCTDILNVGLFRPIFSPADFVQIKGRGTRLHDFRAELRDPVRAADVAQPRKTTFKLFDFFGNCEYFEREFNYDEVIALPRARRDGDGADAEPIPGIPDYTHPGPDVIASLAEEPVGPEGMKIDRMFFDRFADAVRADETLTGAVGEGQWERAIDHVRAELFDKPEDYFTLDRLRRAVAADRRLSLREILEKALGLISEFKSKDQLLEEEFAAFMAGREPPARMETLRAIRTFFKAYAGDGRVRDIIDRRAFGELATDPAFPLADFRAVPEPFRALVPAYVKDYVSPDRFAA